jgi:hypothetical protein
LQASRQRSRVHLYEEYVDVQILIVQRCDKTSSIRRLLPQLCLEVHRKRPDRCRSPLSHARSSDWVGQVMRLERLQTPQSTSRTPHVAPALSVLHMATLENYSRSPDGWHQTKFEGCAHNRQNSELSRCFNQPCHTTCAHRLTRSGLAVVQLPFAW